MSEETTAKTVLGNGIRIITERVLYVRSASLGVWVSVGSSHEEPAQRRHGRTDPPLLVSPPLVRRSRAGQMGPY